MSVFDAIRYRLRTVLRSSAAERERDEEFAFHQSLTEQELLRGELGAEETRHAARRDFGNATYLKEEIRQMGALRWIDALRQDLRFGARTLRRSPVFTLVAVLSIGLGIGANTIIFGALHTLLLQRLPVVRPSELVHLQRTAGGKFTNPFFTWQEYQVLRAAHGAQLAALGPVSVDRIEINGVPLSDVRPRVHVLDGAFFQLLGIGPAAGRLISQADFDVAAPVVVVSYDFARHWFESAHAALGRTITLRGNHFSIIGVTNRRYQGIGPGAAFDIVLARSTLPLVRDREAEAFPDLVIIGRVAGGATGSALAGLAGVFQQCCADGQLAPGPQSDGQHLLLADLSRGLSIDDRRAEYAHVLYALMAGVALLLLIVCTNVGNLLLARALVRSRELAVRLSLGASRARVVRQLLVESALLALLGATLGLLISIWGSRLLAQRLPVNFNNLQQLVAIRPDLVIFAFTAGCAVACALLFGVLPAVRATRLDPISGLREASQSTARYGRLDRAVVALQVGLALVLASSAGLLVATLRNFSAELRGLEPAQLLVAGVDVRGTSYEKGPLRPLYDEIVQRVRQIPSVTEVAGTDIIPLLAAGGSARLLDMPGHENRAEREMAAGIITLAQGYFSAMRIRLKAGRDFGPQDRPGAEQTAIISENIAREFFAGRDPIGATIGFRGASERLRIVGVAENVKYFDLRAEMPRIVYLPWAQVGDDEFDGGLNLAIRTNGNPAAVSAVRAAIYAAAPGVRIPRITPLTELLSSRLGREQALAWLAVAFGTLAVLLAAIGLYGVMAFQVNARSREIGVRMALGADASRVVSMVLRQSFIVIAIGVLAGVPLALFAARAMSALLYGLSPWDPAPLAPGAFILITVGMLASLLPSRNAARVDPLVAIRSD